jgi:hypothetical protein
MIEYKKDMPEMRKNSGEFFFISPEFFPSFPIKNAFSSTSAKTTGMKRTVSAVPDVATCGGNFRAGMLCEEVHIVAGESGYPARILCYKNKGYC